MGRGLKLIFIAVFGLMSLSIIQTIMRSETARKTNIEISVENTGNSVWDEYMKEYMQEPAEEYLIYKDSKEEAVLVFPFKKYPYMQFVNDIIWEKENDEYAVIYYRAIKNKWCEGHAVAKFKIKDIDGKKQYALLYVSPGEAPRFALYEKTSVKSIQESAPLYDFKAVYSIEKEKRFFWGVARDDKIKTLKIEGQSPTEVIEYEFFGKPEYFWYYEDIDSDKPSAEWTIEMEEE